MLQALKKKAARNSYMSHIYLLLSVFDRLNARCSRSQPRAQKVALSAVAPLSRPHRSPLGKSPLHRENHKFKLQGIPHLRSHFLANQIITPWQFSIQIQKLPKSSRTTTYASGVVEFAHALRTELIAEVAEVDLSNKMPYGEGAGIIRMQG